MKGWFDAFRTDGGPTLYSHSNRTAVTGDSDLITVCVVFGTLFIAFLIIYPGVRKEVCVIMQLFNYFYFMISSAS
jgi:dual oxidase maturation factor 1